MKHQLTKVLNLKLLKFFFLFHTLISLNASEKPNIVVFLVDDLGSGELACYSSKFHETPNIDSLASKGMLFTRAYSGSTLCSPSRAALLTGCSPARLHLTDWIPGQKQINRRTITPDWKTYINKQRTLLPEAMKEQGYSTCFIGKWHLIPRPTPNDLKLQDPNRLAKIKAMYSDHLPESNGFDENFGGDHSPNQGRKFFYPKYQKFPGLEGKGSKNKCLTDVLTDCAIDFIERKKGSPFFLYLSYFTVHNPLSGKPEYVKKYKNKLASNSQAGYYMKNPHKAAMIQSLDESVGRVIRQLRKSGQLENTLIIFTGDNGSQGNEFVPDFRGNKGTAYEGGTRVPLIISGPNVKKGITDQATIAMDLYPTILDFIKAPLKPEEHQDGISITPILQGEAQKKRLFYWHYPHYDETTPYSSAILGDWKIIHYADDGKVELYNLKDDPLEQNNLVVRFPEKTAELSRRLESKLQSVNAQKALKNPNFNPNTFSGGIREYWRLEELKKKKKKKK